MKFFYHGESFSKILAMMLIFTLVFSPMAVFAETAEPEVLTQEAGELAAEAEGQATEVPELTEESAHAFLEMVFSQPEVTNGFHGAAVSIVKDGEVLAQEGFGLADIEKNEAVDPENTVFRVASVSKVFTAVAVMQLVEQGKIDLDEDIQTYLGDISYENPFDEPVTVAHLLTHTTGFEVRDPHQGDIHTDFDQIVEIEDYVRANMPSVVREPGSAYMYDNFASLLQGYLVEKVSGEPFQTYMDNYIFTPLGMEDSGFLLEGKLLENLATGYDAAGQALDVYTFKPTVMPHGGMLTTAADMSKFMIAFLNGGQGEKGRILSEASVQEMTEYRAVMHDLLPNTTYGFEAGRQLPGAGISQDIITKAGDLGGFSSYIWFMPEDNIGVFVTYNNNGTLRDQLFMSFIYQFFPQYAAPAELGNFEPSPEQDLGKFEGLYADLRLSSLVSTIKLGENGQLTLSSVYLGETPLMQVDDLLFVDPNGLYVGFKEDDNGEIAYMDEPYLNPLGIAAKAEAASGFADIDADHPYAEYIHGLQSLGLYANDAAETFGPDQLVTRAEYIQNLMTVSGLKGSENPSVFEDVYGHEAAPQIQLAYEMGVVSGNEHGLFEPDRPITRQEAATVVYRSYISLFPEGQFEEVKLAGETSPWAEAAVKLMVGLGYYGPEVEIAEDGAVNFQSKRPMTRQEEAAHHYLLLTKPIF